MTLKSRLLAAFAVLSMVAAACATSQNAPTTAGGTSTVEELPNEEGAPAQPQAAQPAAPAAPQFQTIGSPEEHFTAKMPGAPQVTRNKATIPAGEVTTSAWASNVDGVVYSLLAYDYPEKLVASNAPEAFLNQSRNDLVSQLKAVVKSEEPVVLDGYPGKAFTLSSDSGEVRARAFLVGTRVYTLFALYNPSVGAPAADEFLKSLTLINPPPKVQRAPRASTGAADAGTPGGADAGTPGATDAGR